MYLQLQSTMTRPPSRRSAAPDAPPQPIPSSARAPVRSTSPSESLPRRRSSKRAPAHSTQLPEASSVRHGADRVARALSSSPPEAITRRSSSQHSTPRQGNTESLGRRRGSRRSPAASPSPDSVPRQYPESSRRRNSTRSPHLVSSPDEVPRRRPSSRTPRLSPTDDDQGRRRTSSHSLPADMPPDSLSYHHGSGPTSTYDEQGRRRTSSHSLPSDMPPDSGSRRRARAPSSALHADSGSRRRSTARTSSPVAPLESIPRKRTSVRAMPRKIQPKSPPRSTLDASSYGVHRSSNKSNSGDSFGSDYEPMTAVYRHARKHEWDQMISRCRLCPHEAKYVHPVDGTTALHVAVMSRTGYSPPVHPHEGGQVVEPKEPCPAPLEVIEELLLLCPDAANVVCKINSYTPLAYACLVSGDEWNLEDSAAMVRLFLQHARDSLSIFTEGGLSALDVHIISFSYKKREQQAEDNVMSGRTSTVVLRTLLEADPCLAHVRIRKDKVGGPIELLYRCNSGAFLDAVDLDDKSYMKKRAENDKSVIRTIKDWWVWKWTVLLLKYGTVPYKKKGAPFLTVQAAAGMVGCPLPVLTLAIRAFPKQIRQPDEMQGNKGNLPLHQVATWPCQQDSESMDPVISSRKGMAISALVQEYPDAARITNNLKQTPLELAVESGTTWDGGVRKLVRANPNALSVPSPSSRLLPFLTAAAASNTSSQDPPPPCSSRRSLTMHLKAIAKRDLQSVRTIYGLLRADPMVLTKLYCYDYDEVYDE